MSRPDHLLFLHIPKTAGTTLHNILHRHYPKQQQLETNVFIHRNELENFSPEERKNFRLVRGHFPFGLHTLLGGRPFEYLTMVREPVDRCVSHYYYIKNRRQKGKQGAKPMNATLAELCTNGEFLFVDNLQVRFLSGNMDVPFGSVTEEMLDAAIANLDKHFPVYGVQEEFDAFVLLLAERYNFRLPYYRPQRVSANREKVSELPAETRAALEKRNAFDIRLYHHVKKKFEQLVAERGAPFRERLVKFRKRNERFAKVVNWIPFFPKRKGGAD